MKHLTLEDLNFIEDQALRSWKTAHGKLPGMKRDVNERERRLISYFEAVTRLLLQRNAAPELVLLQSDSNPEPEDYS